MQVRPILPEEYPQANDISTLAFAFARPEGQPREPQKPDAHLPVRGCFDETGRMTAGLEIHPFRVRYEGHVVEMGGIGNVTSLPETRRQGNIRALFCYSLREMYDRGMPFSALYPFSHRYYRQFGYELACAYRSIEVNMAVFDDCRATGTVRQWKPGDDTADIRAVYDAWTAQANLAFVRDDARWDKWLNHDPYSKRQLTYVWYDEAGCPGAYVILHTADKPEGRQLHVEELACRDRAGLVGLFGLLRTMIGMIYKTFAWRVPTWIDPFTLFPEPYDIQQTVVAGGMVRVVRVQDMLALMRYPAQAGAFSLWVEDAYLPENTGLWRVAYGAGQAQVTRDAQGTADAADLVADIPSLTQLLMGYVGLDELLWGRAQARVQANADTLRAVFTKRAAYMTDHF